MLNQQRMVLEPFELKKLLQNPGLKGLLVLDVREPEEYSDWRIAGSVNIPFNTLLSHGGVEKLPRESEIVVICAHGRRSLIAALSLRQAGFNAVSLKDGLVGWGRVYDVALVSTTSDGFRFFQIRRIGKGCTSYVVCYGEEAVVIDPTVHIDEFISLAEKEGTLVSHVMDTHLHADHVSGARALSHATGAVLHLNPLEQYANDGFMSLTEGQKIQMGKASIDAIHTPGHTKGSTSFLVEEKYLLTGDILFVEGLARPDLHRNAEEFAHDLFITYRDLLAKFSGDVTVLPAHYSPAVSIEFGKPFSSTLAELSQRLPKLQTSEKEFLEYVLGNIPAKPPSYEKILQINKTGAQYSMDEVDELEEGPNRCALRA